MLSQSLALLVAATTVCFAKTPTGFQPTSNTDLIVDFQQTNTTALNGVTISKEASASQPRIGTTTQLRGTSYAALMIDLDIPTGNGNTTNTLLHWMQGGLTPATTATAVGGQNVFLLQNSSQTSPAAPYFGPNPPARNPLSHRYTQILVDTSDVSAQATNALQSAAANRMGFKAQEVLQQAGLENKVVAGNFFVVKNAGPAQEGNGGNGGNGGNSGNGGNNGNSGNGGSTGSTTGSGSSSTTVPVGEAGSVGISSGTIFSLVAANFVFLLL